MVSNFWNMNEPTEVRMGRYLTGEMSEQERLEWEQEVHNDPVLAREFETVRKLWHHSDRSRELDWDTERAWEKVAIQQSSGTKPLFAGRMLVYRIAAALLLGIAGVYMIFFSRTTPVLYNAESGHLEDPVVLKDGSQVFLHHGAVLKVYPFSKKKRLVELTGEGYFEVQTDPSSPFEVLCGATRTEVVGTAFTLRQEEGHEAIYVTSGKVIFSLLEHPGQAIALIGGESAIRNAERLQHLPNPSPNVNAWHTRQLKFVNMELQSVVQDISDYFDVAVQIESPAVRSCRISIPQPFSQPEIRSVLRAITISINATLVQEDGRFIIRGGTCN